MGSRYLIALALALLGLLTTRPASALQATAWIDMSAPAITVTDLNPGDGIAPVFALSNLQSSASVFWYKYYWTTLGGDVNSSSDWTSDLSATYATPGATGNAAWTNSLGTTAVSGYDDDRRLHAGIGRFADFTLTGNTQVDIWIPVGLTLDATGHDAYRQAYANTQLVVWSLDPDFGSTVYDYLRLESWFGNGDLSGTLHVTFTNLGVPDLSGYVAADAFSDTMSSAPVPETVPGPSTMLLLGLGLIGLVGVRRRFKK